MDVNDKFNVAICMYGQWREGDICGPYIKEFFRSDDNSVQVDYFCSVKDYDLHGFFNKESVQHDTAQLVDKLRCYYDPKNLIITNDRLDIPYNYHGKKYVSIVDAIMLKRKYELENNFKYNLVILTRYDTLIRPLEYFRNLVRCIKSYKNLIGIKNLIFSQLLEYNYSYTLADRGYNTESWADYLIAGVNSGLDLFASECMKLADFSNTDNIHIDLHYVIPWAMSNTHGLLQVGIMPYYRTSDESVHLSGNIMPGNFANDFASPRVVFLRPGFQFSEHDNLYTEHTFNKIGKYYNDEFTGTIKTLPLN